MNQRIQELAQAAEQLADDELAHLERVHNRLYSFTEGREIYNKKFAELIVQECAAYLNGAMEVHNQRDQDLMDLAARKIKQHLGVE